MTPNCRVSLQHHICRSKGTTHFFLKLAILVYQLCVLTLTSPKRVLLWQVLFLIGFIFIKISICLTLLRIALIRWHRTTLWMLIAVTVVSTIFADLYILLEFQPIATASLMVQSQRDICVHLGSTIAVSITFIISACNLISDVSTALVPFLLLKGVQVTKKNKRASISISPLEVLASIATIAHFPLAQAYLVSSKYLCLSFIMKSGEAQQIHVWSAFT